MTGSVSPHPILFHGVPGDIFMFALIRRSDDVISSALSDV